MGVKNPCVKECQDRSATCHATCEKYAKFAVAKEAERQERAKKKRDLPTERHWKFSPYKDK